MEEDAWTQPATIQGLAPHFRPSLNVRLSAQPKHCRVVGSKRCPYRGPPTSVGDDGLAGLVAASRDVVPLGRVSVGGKVDSEIGARGESLDEADTQTELANESDIAQGMMRDDYERRRADLIGAIAHLRVPSVMCVDDVEQAAAHRARHR